MAVFFHDPGVLPAAFLPGCLQPFFGEAFLEQFIEEEFNPVDEIIGLITYLSISYHLGDVDAVCWSFGYVPRDIRIVDNFEIKCLLFVLGLSVEFSILSVGSKVEECCPVVFFILLIQNQFFRLDPFFWLLKLSGHYWEWRDHQWIFWNCWILQIHNFPSLWFPWKLTHSSINKG